MGTKQKAMVGAFLVGGVALFAFALFLIGDRRLLFASSFELETSFTRITGVEVGTSVRVAGLNAGEVLSLQLPSQPAQPFVVVMRLRDDLRPIIRSDSVAAIQTDGIVGNTFIQVGRGSDAAPMVESGDSIAGQDPVGFSDLIEDGRAMFRQVSVEMTDIGDDMSETVAALADVARTVDGVIANVGTDVEEITTTGVRLAEDARVVLAEARSLTNDVRSGQGTIGRFLNDDALYQRWVGLASEAEQTMANLRMTTNGARELMDGLSAQDGATQQTMQALRDTLVNAREAVSDLSEGTEALKRNFLFRGFFQQRGFFDLDAVSRDDYVAGQLTGNDRTRLRVWIDADGLFATEADGTETLTEDGRRRIDSAMADLVRYPRDSPLVVEGYAEDAPGQAPYLVSSDRALLVREYLVTRFRRSITLTGIMPMSDEAPESPRGDGRWSGVALALFVRNDALGSGQ